MYSAFLRCAEGQDTDNYGLKTDCKDWPQETLRQLRKRQEHYEEDLANPVSCNSCSNAIEHLPHNDEVRCSHLTGCWGIFLCNKHQVIYPDLSLAEMHHS